MKEVDIFAHSHWPNDPYLADIPAKYDVFVVENMSSMNIGDVFGYFSRISPKKRTPYERDMEQKLMMLKKQWTKLLVGDFCHNNDVIDLALITSPERYMKLFEKIYFNPTLDNIKDLYFEWWQSEWIRNTNFIANVSKAEGYIWVRFWTAHSIIVAELQKLGYDIFLSISPTLYDYHVTLTRKIYLHHLLSDTDYYKWWVSLLIHSLLQKDQNVHKNIYGKSFEEIQSQQNNMINAFVNCLIDGLTETQLTEITDQSLEKLFTYNNVTNPLETRIKRQEIRDFLKNFSMKK